MIFTSRLKSELGNHKATIFTAILLGMVMLFSNPQNVLQAQSFDIPQKNYDYRVYRDTASQMLYWPKALPVYVRLSASDNSAAPSHLLKEAAVTSSDESETNGQKKNKIELEISGNQYIRWVDFKTKDTLMFLFQADGIAPATQILLEGAPKYENDGVTYYGRGLTADFEANDDHSGIQDILVSVNGADYSPYFGRLEFGQPTNYIVKYYSVDNVGNMEDAITRNFQVDLNAPVSDLQVEGTHQGSILAPSAKITLGAEDDKSGIKNILEAMNDTTQAQMYDDPIEVSALDEGNHTLYYHSTDQVENVEKWKSYRFYLDQTSPETQLVVEGDQYENGAFYVSSRTRYLLEFKDNKTGVKNTQFYIDNNPETDFTGEKFQLPETEGGHTVTFWSVDNVENREADNTRNLFLDRTPPESSHEFRGVSFDRRGTTWITSETAIALNASDSDAGVQQTYYTIDNDVQDAEYTEPIRLSTEQKYLINYYSVDNVNNTESAKTASIVVDDTPPEIIMNYSSGSIGSSSDGDGPVLEQYPLNTVMYVAATDQSSGANNIWISKNGGGEKPYTMPVKFESPGEQELQIRTRDNVGNERIKEIRIIIAE